MGFLFKSVKDGPGSARYPQPRPALAALMSHNILASLPQSECPPPTHCSMHTTIGKLSKVLQECEHCMTTFHQMIRDRCSKTAATRCRSTCFNTQVLVGQDIRDNLFVCLSSLKSEAFIYLV